jgi:hypothetical protein
VTRPHPVLLQLAAGREPGRVADEAALVESASEHRMGSTVLAAHQGGDLALSAEGATKLAVEELAQRHVHLQLWEGASEVQTALAPLGAEVAVLKGIATEARWYDHLGQRTCTDLDLLLDPSRLTDAAEVTAAIDPARGCAEALRSLVPRRQLQHVDLHVGDVPVDLHFDPLKIGIPTRQLDAVWQSTQVLETPRGRVRVLSPEVELVLLLLHLNKDAFRLLGPFLDVARILERAPIDWRELRRFVSEEGLDVPVWRSLLLVAETLGLDVEVPVTGGVRAVTWDRLWRPSAIRGLTPAARTPAKQWLLGWHARRRGWDNVREARRQIAPPRPLLEVAGRLPPGTTYLRHVVVDRVLRRAVGPR